VAISDIEKSAKKKTKEKKNKNSASDKDDLITDC
jgi:hypothetical protein